MASWRPALSPPPVGPGYGHSQTLNTLTLGQTMTLLCCHDDVPQLHLAFEPRRVTHPGEKGRFFLGACGDEKMSSCDGLWSEFPTVTFLSQ